MIRAALSFRRPMWRLRLLATMLAVAGQLGLSSASLALARDEASAAVHVERTGIDIHHGHNDATCAACAALSSHADPNPGPPIPIEDAARLVAASRTALRVAEPSLRPNSCRAPPTEA